MGWLGTTALAMGGSNQSLFLVGALIAGEGSVSGHGSAAILLLIIGLVLGWMAVAGWTELILMWPNRVGGIAGACAEAFRPYAPVLANLTGVSYWWGWVPTCGLTALLSASAIQQWFLPDASVAALACGIIVFFTLVNLCGVHWAARIAIVIAAFSSVLAFLSAIIPVWAGTVDWQRAFTFHLETPFPGHFGDITSFMAGLYLVGFAAPAFEAAACHVGETIDRNTHVPRAMYMSACMATLYFVVLPIIWLGALGPEALSGELAEALGPTFAPLLGGFGKAAAIGFMMFNMFHGTLAPLTGVARTLSQLAEDGLLPACFEKRSRTDCPWVAIVFTAVCAIVFLMMGDPVWLVAAANFTYLIGIALPSIAVWLLRKDRPDLPRPYRAPRGTITLGVIAAAVWGLSTVLGFQQFGLPTVLFGLGLAYSGSALYAWRKWSDRHQAGLPGIAPSLHLKLTGAMLAVLVLDGSGYLLAVSSVPSHHAPLVAALEDIFVVVAIITIGVGLVLPGMIAHSAVEVAAAADRLAKGTLADFSRAMQALSSGDLDAAYARVDISPVVVRSRDELGDMASSFNTLQEEIARAAVGLEGAREGLRAARGELTQINASLEHRVMERTGELEMAHRKLVDAARYAGMAEVATGILHNLGNVLNSVNVSAGLVQHTLRHSQSTGLDQVAALLRQHADDLGAYVTLDDKGRLVPQYLDELAKQLSRERGELLSEIESMVAKIEHIKQIVVTQQSFARASSMAEPVALAALIEDAILINLVAMDQCDIQVERRYEQVPLVTVDKHQVLQILVNLLNNATQALNASTDSDKRLVLRLSGHGTDTNRVVLQVIDNGIGIAKENLTRIFEHGFTTRKGGRGFGLHSSAIAAQAIGGSLRAHSDGPAGGAVFTLDLPLQPAGAGV